MARFAFPRSPHASVLIDAGGSAKADDLAEVRIDPGRREISGSASSGYFCAQRPRYRVYFAAVFDRPFDAYGTWTRQKLAPGSTAAVDQKPPSTVAADTAQAGAYASFDTRRNRVVTVRVGVSFVSVAGARANLAAESRGASFRRLAAAAEASWNRALASIRVGGGSERRRRHLLHRALPRAARAAHLRRRRRPLHRHGRRRPRRRRPHPVRGPLGLGRLPDADPAAGDADAAPRERHRRLDARRRGAERLPAALVLRQRAEHDDGRRPGRPDHRLGGRLRRPALRRRRRAGGDGQGRERRLRQRRRRATSSARASTQYRALGYVPFDLDVRRRNANSLFGDPEAVWASAATTLEYAIADFSIAQFAARALGDRAAYRTFISRSGNWRNLLNPAQRPDRAALRRRGLRPPLRQPARRRLRRGRLAQYTWMVPHDPAGLFAAIGGRAGAATRLDRFLRTLNGGPGATHADHALLGNEPNLNVPWLYDWAGQPYKTQAAVRRRCASTTPRPDGYPGNDDLGTLSSWYVLGALGLYPEVPGVGVLAIGSPLFGRATRAPGGRAQAADPRLCVRRSRRGRAARQAPPRPPSPPGPHTSRRCASTATPTGGPGRRSARWRAGRPSPTARAARRHRAWGASAAALPPSFGTARGRCPRIRCAP